MVRPESIATLPHLYLQRYLGTWFETFRITLKWEDQGMQDITAPIARRTMPV